MSAAIAQIVNTTDEDAKEVDALGDMQPAVKAAKKLVKEYDERVKKVRERHGGGDAEQTRIIPGYRHSMELTPANKERVVSDIRRLVEILGEDVFLQVCKVALTDIDKYVPEHQKHEVLEFRRGTTRSAKFSARS